MQKHHLDDLSLTANMPENVASSLFNNLLDSATSYAATKILRTIHPFFQKKVYGLVMASPDTHDWAHRLRHHFMMEFNSLYPCAELELETVFVAGGPGEMQAALINHPLLKGNDAERFSFALTPGYTESMLFDEARFMLNVSLPQIYCVPGSLTAPFSKVREGIAGVHNAMMHPQEYVDALKALVPDLKRIAIAYTAYVDHKDEQDMVQRQAKLISQAFVRAGVQVEKHLWDDKNMAEDDLKRLLMCVDALITVDDIAMQKHRSKVIELCNAYRKPLCSSELDSVFAGAALGCGITRDAFAKPMLRVLHHMMFPRRRMVASVEIPMQNGMRYNLNGVITQGIILSDEDAALLRMKSIYDLDIISL